MVARDTVTSIYLAVMSAAVRVPTWMIWSPHLRSNESPATVGTPAFAATVGSCTRTMVPLSVALVTSLSYSVMSLKVAVVRSLKSAACLSR